MGELLALAVIMLVAVLVFEAAWRIALALLIFGPAAYAAIVAGWLASHFGLGPIWSASLALVTGLALRWVTVFAFAYGALQVATIWRRAFGSSSENSAAQPQRA